MPRRSTIWGFALLLGIALAAPSAFARCQKRKGKKTKRYCMTMRHANTKERFTNLWVIRHDPKNKNRQWVGKRARKRLTHFLRDWRTNKTKRVPERLLWNLYLVGQRFDAPIEIVSSYRYKERKTSRHKQGKAIDFRVIGVPPREVWKYCKRFDNVGLGLYPTSKFVHMDVRDRSYYWVDDSGPGEESEYREGVGQRKQKKKRKKTKKKKRSRKKSGKKAKKSTKKAKTSPKAAAKPAKAAPEPAVPPPAPEPAPAQPAPSAPAEPAPAPPVEAPDPT